MFLYLCMCRYGYVENERKQKQNRQKRAREWKKVKSRSRGSKMTKKSSNYHQKSSGIHKVTYLVPGQKFEELASLVPAVSVFDNKGPSKIIQRKIIIGPS